MSALEFTPTDYRIMFNGDSGFTIFFDRPANRRLTKQILSIVESLKSELSSELHDIIPSYQSLTILFNPGKFRRQDILIKIKHVLASPIAILEFKNKLIELPVCYAPKYAPDLTRVADICELSIEEVIHRHTQPTYWIAMLGFLPGFIYLSGLNQSLYCPRKTTPRLSVAQGSIAIGDKQTGVYSLSSPGGWNIIGRTPNLLLALNSEQPTAFKPLDEIKFTAISEAKFLDLQQQQGDRSIL